MLVLKRKAREKVLIGREIIVTVLNTTLNGVSLGIEAPSNIRVLRDELNRKPGRRSRTAKPQSGLLPRQ